MEIEEKINSSISELMFWYLNMIKVGDNLVLIIKWYRVIMEKANDRQNNLMAIFWWDRIICIMTLYKTIMMIDSCIKVILCIIWIPYEELE